MIKATHIDHMGSDLSVVNAARVSFGKKSDWKHPSIGQEFGLSDRDTKLVYYLAKHKHTSPFGHCFATFHVKAPMFVARQLVKHKFLRWNEISRRYVDDDPKFYEPKIWRERSDDKKQGSSDIEVTELEDSGWGEYHEFDINHYDMKETIEGWHHKCYDLYDLLIRNEVCPEQARMILPQSTMTEWYWSGSLDAFSDMCLLRCASDTQAETQEVANQISHKMHELFPVSWMALAKGRG